MPAHTFHSSNALGGTIRVPGDKSISHRALMFSALAIGESTIEGLLEGEDVLATAAAMRQLGAQIERGDDGIWRVNGAGLGSLLEPKQALDMGNSGTSTRLLMGLLASHGFSATFTGDASLSGRPMNRVIEPLSQMGAQFEASSGGTLPLMLRGASPAVPIKYRLPVASAQVKSAVLLAGLNTPGITSVIEPVATRDHTERMLTGFGATLEIGEQDGAEGPERIISIHGEADLKPQHVIVPSDPSSAAFFMVAALIIPGSDIVIENVGMNDTRAGIVHALRQMGGQIEELNAREVGGEPVADLRVRHSALKGADIDPAIVPSMVDEFPVLFVAAAMAEGTTRTTGLEELRVKESDRIATMAAALTLAGAKVEEHEDGLTIQGTGGEQLRGTPQGASVETKLDHRIVMSMAIAGLVSRDGVSVDDTAPIATSFPTFIDLLTGAAR
uniref:3-phosphoshikimate 1-carboxyvinyltransferase n=1 Tax=uncultured Erythrobacter sp. TaxID=263913 RepID=UPI002618A2D3|nr:3-phosphoshikimate 1-carboxyvinyltransferase [uncultured Erythrobacter sp.]